MHKMYSLDQDYDLKFFEEDEVEYLSNIYIFEYESEEEADDFGFLSFDEQLMLMGFREDKTPMGSGTVHRYVVDFDETFVIVRETIIKL